MFTLLFDKDKNIFNLKPKFHIYVFVISQVLF